jgi:hypothetical protein
LISKDLNISINKTSWKRRPLPLWAVGYLPTQSIDISHALLMLGTVTTPNGLSAGSPERYWACIRYFSACTASPDLRIQTAFMDLDPHQKGILSDDFGVALSMTWLVKQMGNVRDIVDGRQFMINMGVRRPTPGRPLPKVGRLKCPDFVMEDQNGKFHILECKGTQSGRGYLNRAMATGQIQKRGIKVAKALRGESLVIGISLAGEGEDRDSQLVVIDPEEEPLTIVRASDAQRATVTLTRLSLARGLNLNGFSRLAFEISWPDDLNKDSAEAGLLTQTERKILSITREDRQVGLQEEITTEFSSAPTRLVNDFVTQQMSFDLPALKLDSGNVIRRVTVRRGVHADLIHKLSRAKGDGRAAASELSTDIAKREERINIGETENSVSLKQEGLFFSEIVLD